VPEKRARPDFFISFTFENASEKYIFENTFLSVYLNQARLGV
jgi:hypothetical protein